MDDFISQIQCDELPYEPTAEDIAECCEVFELFFKLEEEHGCEPPEICE